jgi:predicted NBD/HSP70 family sugar kinase
MVFTAGATQTATYETVRGTNLIGVRAYNERLILSLVRRHGHLSKADMSRSTGLSAQTVSVIVRALEADKLLLRLPPQRGRIGQPSVPLTINPDGAFSIGLKIGRRSADLVFMDFAGSIRQHLHWTYPYPVPEDVLAFLGRGMVEIIGNLTERERQQIAGLGVATPFQLWNWSEEIGAPESVLEVWREINLQAEITTRHALPVFVSNDATAACGAELTFGIDRGHPDFIYFFVGAFVGGGVVLGRSLHAGRFGNAGALGSMPIGNSRTDSGTLQFGSTKQLIVAASLVRLEERLAAEGYDPSSIFRSPSQWAPIGPLLDEWINNAAGALAHAIVASVSVIDFGAAVIDGGFPPDIRCRLVSRVRECVAEMDLRGLTTFEVLEGSVGANARAIGGACLPFFAKYLLNRDVLFKDDA